MFLDNSSILLGQQFERALEDGVRRSGVLVALIGPGWDRPPLLDHLEDPGDWVRRELILAEQHGVLTIPVLVDRQDLPTHAVLPAELGSCPGGGVPLGLPGIVGDTGWTGPGLASRISRPRNTTARSGGWGPRQRVTVPGVTRNYADTSALDNPPTETTRSSSAAVFARRDQRVSAGTGLVGLGTVSLAHGGGGGRSPGSALRPPCTRC